MNIFWVIIFDIYYSEYYSDPKAAIFRNGSFKEVVFKHDESKDSADEVGPVGTNLKRSINSKVSFQISRGSALEHGEQELDLKSTKSQLNNFRS